MKKFIIFLLCVLMTCITCGAQNYVREGNTFTSVHQEQKSKDIKTPYKYKDTKGKVYDIYITPKNACYVIKTSSKTGKTYKYYLPKDITYQVAVGMNREVNVDYD